MPRIVVLDGTRKLLDEHVIPDHLHDQYSAVQLLERLAWALEDADKHLRSRSRRRPSRATRYTEVSSA